MSESLADDLWVAVADGDVDRVRTLLQGGADPNHPVYLTKQWWSKEYGEWNWRRPPLNTACENGMLQMVKLLVQHGADIDGGDGRDGQTPLHHACVGGHKEVVVYLTREAGCRIDVKDKTHLTPLHWACVGGNKETVQYLVEELKCDVDVRAVENVTPLHLACQAGSKEIVQYLVEECRCDVGVRGMGKSTALHYACVGGNKETVQFLVETLKCDVGVRADDNSTVLHYACDGGNKETVQYLVEELKCDLGVTDDNGDTPLDYATEKGRTEVVEYLKSLPRSSTPPGAVGTTDPQSSQSSNSEPQSGPQSSQSPNSEPSQPVTPLSQEEADALRVVLINNGLQPSVVPLEDSHTLERVQQLLVDKGHTELATNLRANINEVIQVRKQYLRTLDNLMTDKDTIALCYYKVLLVGPPGVGKTTTLNRLLKAYENIRTAGDKGKRRSTLLANCTQVLAFVSQDDAADWLSSSSGDDDEEAILLIRYLCGGVLKPKEMIGLKKLKPRAGSKPHEKPTDEETSRIDDEPSLPTATFPTATKADSLPQHLLLMKEQLRKLVGGGNYTKAITHLGNTLLNINDIGGQPGFLEMLPALSTGPAMYLLFLDLSKELNQPYEISFDRDNTVIMPFKSLHTVESTISQILSSIASAHCISRESSSLDPQKAAFFGEKFQCFQEIQPVAALIGTHLDKLEDREQKIKETSESLKKVTQKFSKIVVPPPQSTSAEATSSSPFFSVNNYDGEEAVDIAPIRTFMNEIFQSRFQEASLPVQKKWLILNIILRREYRIAEMKHCYEIGEMLDIDKEEVKFCLWYLDCIGTLMYYTNIPDDWFKDHVICFPQVIFDSISQLIVSSMCKLHSGVVTGYEREELVCNGQLSIESIKMHCCSAEVTEKLKKSELIPVKQLIQLLEHVKLLSPIIHKEADGERITYLMPAVLDCATQDELTTPPTPDANNPEPLLITFTCGYVPTGTFCGLITQLVSHGPQGILGLEWGLVEDGVKRNLVSFYVDYVNKVTLICHDRCYEIRVRRNDPKKSLHDICSYVLSVVLYSLKALFKNVVTQIAFHCPCSSHATRRDINNLCTLIDSKGSIRSLCVREIVTLRITQQVWLGKVVTPGLFAELEVLKYAEDEFSSHWTKEGSRRQIKTTSEPNVLTFQSVSEEDLGYYRCEVREAGKVVLTVYRALYKDETNVALTKKKEEPVSTSTSGDLTHKDVVRLTRDARDRWFDLGIELDIDLNTLQAIRKENNNRVDDCLPVMIEHWVGRHAPSPTWSALVEALSCNVIGRSDMATIVESKYKIIKMESLGECGFTLKWIRRVTWEVRSNWRDLGIELEVDSGTLKAIRKTHHDVDDCFTEMLSHWLKRSTPSPSWEQLVEALGSPFIEREDIVELVKTRWSESWYVTQHETSMQF